MTQVDKTAARYKAMGDTVTQVYLCSDTQNTNIISAKHMKLKYPRPFKYVVIPHIAFSDGTEAEFVIRNKFYETDNSTRVAALENVTTMAVYSEFLADVRILAHADVYIGSHSNIYILVAGLRMALYPSRPPIDCGYLDTRSVSTRYASEGLKLHDGTSIFGNALGKFTGGTPFW
jgi:hypothetical protein